MTFKPGYAVTQVHQPPTRRTITSAGILNNQSALGRLRGDSAAPKELAATEFVLPAHIPATWDEWYQGVAHAIYQVWVQQNVCPGSATVRTTVWDTQDAEGQVMDFTPAADIRRNARTESDYREAALKSVNSLDKARVCVFPAKHPKKVVFDIQLTRLVNGPAGCQVVHTDQSETMRPLQR
jgi:hypothetical protein